MSLPSDWVLLTFTGTYLNRDAVASPAVGAIQFIAPEILTLNGKTLVGVTQTVPLDSAGQFTVTVLSPNTPGLNNQGWPYLIVENIPNGRPPYYVPVAAGVTAIDLSDVAPVEDPQTGQLYVKGDPGPPAYTLKGAVATYADLPTGAAERDAYEVLADGSLYVFANGAWPADGAGVPFRGATGPSGEANLSGADPLALGTAAAGTSVDASRSDHVHPMPSATDVGLGNVDNTSDLDKPVSSAQAEAIAARMANPMTAAGDFVVGGTSGAPTRLAATSTIGQLIRTVMPGGVAWSAPRSLCALDFGVVGDGVTDDMLPLQAVLDAAGSRTVKRVWLPRNTYLCSNVLVIPSGVTLEGDGGSQSVIVNPAGQLAGKSLPGGLVYASIAMSGVEGAAVRGIGIDHATNGTLANSIYLGSLAGAADTTDCVVEGCTVDAHVAHQYLIWSYRAKKSLIRNNDLRGNSTPGSGFDQTGVEVYGGNDVRILDNTMTAVAAAPINIWEDNVAGSDTSVNNIQARGNRADGGVAGALITLYSSAKNIIVADNIFTNQESSAINLGGDAANIAVADIQIADNTIDSCGGVAVLVDSQSSANWKAVRVAGNTITHTGSTDGAVQIRAPNVVIAQNVVVDSAGMSLDVDGGSNATITGNVFSGAQGLCAQIQACTNVVFSHNRCVGYNAANGGSYGVLCSAAGSTITHNSFNHAGGETYAVYSTAANVTIAGNTTEYVPTMQTPFYNQGTGGIAQQTQGVMGAGGNIQGSSFKGAMTLSAGYASANTSPIFATQNWYNAAVKFDGYKLQIIDNLSADGSTVLQILGGPDGTTKLLAVDKTGTSESVRSALQAATPLATPQSGTFEYDGTSLYFTVGTTRKQVTLT